MALGIHAETLKPFPSQLAAERQAALVENSAAEHAGISCAISVPGYETRTGAHGYADTRENIAVSPDMRFGMGSISKSFTSALMLQLVDEGLVDLSDSISKHLPIYHNIDPNVTIEQLLGMTRGIFNFTDSFRDPWNDSRRLPLKIWRPEEILDTYVALMQFTPGTSWMYSNTNYIITGLIIKQVTRSAYAQAVRERLLDPLNLQSTLVGRHEPIKANLAYTDFNYDGIIIAR